MNVLQVRQQVTRLFARGNRHSVGAAIEQELFAMDLIGGASVHPDRVRAAVAGADYEPWVSFEPGGQVELSLPPARDPRAAAAHLMSVTRSLADDLIGHGIVLTAQPVRGCDPATPRYLSSPRYDAMERHFDTLGLAGRRMMRATASTQVCLDWWPGAAGFEQWRVLNLTGPFLAAATTQSAGAEGRLATWLAVDPDRTAFDDRLLQGDDPITAYAAFAAAAADFGCGGIEEHLSTLFPPVRPRGRYLEIRFPDATPASRVEGLVTGLAGLLYDDDRRRAALATLAPELTRLGEHWEAAAAGTGDLERGCELLHGSRLTELAA